MAHDNFWNTCLCLRMQSPATRLLTKTYVHANVGSEPLSKNVNSPSGDIYCNSVHFRAYMAESSDVSLEESSSAKCLRNGKTKQFVSGVSKGSLSSLILIWLNVSVRSSYCVLHTSWDGAFLSKEKMFEYESITVQALLADGEGFSDF